MTLRFGIAAATDLPDILNLLTDDDLGNSRETASLEVYQTAFDRITADDLAIPVVGRRDGQVIAYYQLNAIDGISLNALRRGQIEDVRVASAFRKKGIGRLLFADAETRAHALNCGVLQLVTHQSRGGTRKFYEAIGFTPSHIGFKRYLD